MSSFKTIRRDLVWALALTVAGYMWWRDHRALTKELQAFQKTSYELNAALGESQKQNQSLTDRIMRREPELVDDPFR